MGLLDSVEDSTPLSKAVRSQLVPKRGCTDSSHRSSDLNHRSTLSVSSTLMPPRSSSRISGAVSKPQSGPGASGSKTFSREYKNLGLAEEQVAAIIREDTNVLLSSRLRARTGTRAIQKPIIQQAAPISSIKGALKTKSQKRAVNLTRKKLSVAQGTKDITKPSVSSDKALSQEVKRYRTSSKADLKYQNTTAKQHEQNTRQVNEPQEAARFPKARSKDNTLNARTSYVVQNPRLLVNDSHAPVQSYSASSISSSSSEESEVDSDEDLDEDDESEPDNRFKARERRLQSDRELYHSLGYNALDMESTTTGITSKHEKKKRRTIPHTTKKFDLGLRERRVVAEQASIPDTDRFRLLIRNMHGLGESDTTDPKERRWQADREKCKGSPEALFQHTIMLKAINRDNLGPRFDYACEIGWRSSHPPYSYPSTHLLANPKPDLTLDFGYKEFVGEDKVGKLGSLESHMYPEPYSSDQGPRAFPFLSFEVKGKSASQGDTIARRQMMNTASLALHNIWKFTKGNDKTQARFFQDVRFFTVTGNSNYFDVYMHWAERALPGEVGRILDMPEDFPEKLEEPIMLTYYHTKLIGLANEAFSRERTKQVVQNILNYAKDELLDFLRVVVDDAINRKLGLENISEQDGTARTREYVQNQVPPTDTNTPTALGQFEHPAVDPLQSANSQQVNGLGSSRRKRSSTGTSASGSDGSETERDTVSVESAPVSKPRKRSARGNENNSQTRRPARRQRSTPQAEPSSAGDSFNQRFGRI